MSQAVTITDTANLEKGVDGNPLWTNQQGAGVWSSDLVANAIANATIPAVAGKTAYITGFDFYSCGATAANSTYGIISGLAHTPVYPIGVVAGPDTQNTPIVRDFPNPIPATGPNVAITVTFNALGAGNTKACVNVYGFYK